MGREDQRATAGRLMVGSSFIWAMVSNVMYLARWTAHSSFCSSSSAPTRGTMASSLGSWEDQLQSQPTAHEPQRAHPARIYNPVPKGPQREQSQLINVDILGSRSIRLGHFSGYANFTALSHQRTFASPDINKSIRHSASKKFDRVSCHSPSSDPPIHPRRQNDHRRPPATASIRPSAKG